MLVNIHGVTATSRASLVEDDPRTLAVFVKEVALEELPNTNNLQEFKERVTRHVNDCYGTETHYFNVTVFDHTVGEEVDELTSYPEGHISLIVDAVTNGFHSFKAH